MASFSYCIDTGKLMERLSELGTADERNYTLQKLIMDLEKNGVKVNVSQDKTLGIPSTLELIYDRELPNIAKIIIDRNGLPYVPIQSSELVPH